MAQRFNLNGTTFSTAGTTSSAVADLVVFNLLMDLVDGICQDFVSAYATNPGSFISQGASASGSPPTVGRTGLDTIGAAQARLKTSRERLIQGIPGAPVNS